MLRPRTCQAIREWLAALPAKAASISVDKFDIAIATTQGLLRQENQDRACFARIRSSDPARGPVSIGLLCDGMGGMEAGAECAILAISVILSEFSALMEHEYPGSAFVNAIHAANDELFRRYAGRGGTTLSAVVFSPDRRLGVSAGDSRIYSVSKRMVRQLSADDTVAAEMPYLDALSAASLGLGAGFGDQLTQFLGIGPELCLQEIEFDYLAQGDRLFLLTDGAWRSSDRAFLKLMGDAPDSFQAAQEIVNVSDSCGGIDNTTVLALSRLGDLASNGKPVNFGDDGLAIDLWNAFGRFSLLTAGSSSPERFRIAP